VLGSHTRCCSLLFLTCACGEPNFRHCSHTPVQLNSTARPAVGSLSGFYPRTTCCSTPRVQGLPVTVKRLEWRGAWHPHRALKQVVGWPPGTSSTRARPPSHRQRIKERRFLHDTRMMPPTTWQNSSGRGRGTPGGTAARFECLNLGFGEGYRNRSSFRAVLRISARLSRQRVVRVLAVPTNPLMPNSAQFGRDGAQKQLQRGSGYQRYLPSTSLANSHALAVGHALYLPERGCVVSCYCARKGSCRLRELGVADGGTSSRPTRKRRLPHTPASARPLDVLMSQTVQESVSACCSACVLAGRSGHAGLVVNLPHISATAKSFTYSWTPLCRDSASTISPEPHRLQVGYSATVKKSASRFLCLRDFVLQAVSAFQFSHENFQDFRRDSAEI
jgi:hypothetical protein